jgi:hypothetical protein
MLKSGSRLGKSVASISKCGFASVPPPRLFDYATIVKHLKPTTQSIGAIESAFGMLSKGLVDVPIPMVCMYGLSCVGRIFSSCNELIYIFT